MDSPDSLLVISGHTCFLLLVFILFLHFLVVGSVRQIKLTHVGFRAHVKIASRIVTNTQQFNKLTTSPQQIEIMEFGRYSARRIGRW